MSPSGNTKWGKISIIEHSCMVCNLWIVQHVQVFLKILRAMLGTLWYNFYFYGLKAWCKICGKTWGYLMPVAPPDVDVYRHQHLLNSSMEHATRIHATRHHWWLCSFLNVLPGSHFRLTELEHIFFFLGGGGGGPKCLPVLIVTEVKG